MRSSPSSRSRFVRLPIISRIKRRRTLSPISFVASMTSSARRSAGGWRNSRILPPERYFRSSMQNIGGSAGFSLGRAVSWILARLGLAESSRRQGPFLPRICSKISSRLGWWILSIRQPSIFRSVSASTAERHKASMGIRQTSPSIIVSKSVFSRSVSPCRYSQPKRASSPVAIWYSCRVAPLG